MKHWAYILLMACLILSIGATYKPVLTPGIYPVEPNGDWDLVDFPKDTYHPDAFHVFLLQRPEDIKLELPEGKFDDYQFGEITLGNAGTTYQFVIGNQKNYFYDRLYVDLNQDGVITTEEEIELIEQQNIALGYTRQILEAHLTLDVEYALEDDKKTTHELDIVLTFFYQRAQDNVIAFYTVRNNTFLVGTGMGDKNPVYFALVDADGNGIYNDLGIDMLFVDKNGDHRFDYRKETGVLAGLQEMRGPDGKKGIYRLILSAWPGKLGIVDWFAEYDLTDFEAAQ